MSGSVSGAVSGVSSSGASAIGSGAGSAADDSESGAPAPGTVAGSVSGVSDAGACKLGIGAGTAGRDSDSTASTPDSVVGSPSGVSVTGDSRLGPGSVSVPSVPVCGVCASTRASSLPGGASPSASSVAVSARPVSGNPNERWNTLIAPRVRHPMAPSILPGSNPLSTSARWIASTMGSGAASTAAPAPASRITNTSADEILRRNVSDHVRHAGVATAGGSSTGPNAGYRPEAVIHAGRLLTTPVPTVSPSRERGRRYRGLAWP